MSEVTHAETAVAAEVSFDEGFFFHKARRALRGRGVPFIADQMFVSATNFFSTVIVGRAAGEEALGSYALAFSVMLIMLVVQQSLICLPYTIRLRELNDVERRHLAGSSLLLSLIVGASLTAAVGMALLLVGPSVERSVMLLAMALALAIPFSLLRDFARRISFAHLDAVEAMIVDVLVLGLQLSMMLVLWHFDWLSAVSSFLVIAVACGVASVWWLWRHRSGFEFTRVALAQDVRRNFSLGSWVLGSQTVAVVNSYLIYWLAAAKLGTAAGGFLAACNALVSLSNPFLLGMYNFLAPRLAVANCEEGRRGLMRVVFHTSAFLASGMILFCVASFLLGDLFVRFVYGITFAEAGTICGLLALAELMVAVGAAPDQTLWVKHRPAVSFTTGLVGLCCMIGLSIWLMPQFQIVGVAAALAIGNAITAAARWMAIQRVVFSGKGTGNE